MMRLTINGMVSQNYRGSEMVCKWCKSTGILMMVTKTLHGKDFRAEMCECELEAQYGDQKVLIDDVREDVPESKDCSKGVKVSPE